MKFSMTGKEKGDLLIQVTAKQSDCLGKIDCSCYDDERNKMKDNVDTQTFTDVIHQ